MNKATIKTGAHVFRAVAELLDAAAAVVDVSEDDAKALVQQAMEMLDGSPLIED